MSIVVLIYSILAVYSKFICLHISDKYCDVSENQTLANHSKHVELATQPNANDYQVKKPHSIRVEVYYEVLCPDSRYFILHQLYPTWQKIGDIMEVHFKPFGKASYQQSPRGYTFKCQHGPAECQGNMVHACAIKYVAKPALLMEYVKCMMNDNYEPKTAGAKCAESLGIDWSVIDKCVDSREGQELLAMYGDDTHSLRPKISFVPTILLDGSQNGQKDILKNLRLQICRMYSGRSPENCMEVV